MRVATILGALACAAAGLADDSQRRPCGPGGGHSPVRALWPQGFLGADFRPACRGHDSCYERPGVSKDQCDLEFHHRMLEACEGSAAPGLCKAGAHLMHAAVRTRASVRIFLRTQGR